MQRQASRIILNLSNRAATARYQGVEKPAPAYKSHTRYACRAHKKESSQRLAPVPSRCRSSYDAPHFSTVQLIFPMILISL